MTDQIITPVLDTETASPGDIITIDVNYATEDPPEAPSTGTVFRLHWDSSQLEFDPATDLENLFPFGVQPTGGIEDDVEDFDDDPDTDKYFIQSWIDTSNSWPNLLDPTPTLYTASFTALEGFSETTINFSSDQDQLPPDFEFVPTSATIEGEDGPGGPGGPGNTLETAVDLGVLNIPQLETGFVGTDDSNDFYRFSITTESDFNLMLTGLVADADVDLLADIDGDGVVSLDEVLDGSAAGGDTDEEIDAVLEPGEYFINVFSFSGETDYSLEISAIPTGGGGPGNTLETAVDLGVLNMPQLETGFVGTDDTDDFYRFSITTESDFNLMLTGLVADADVRLLGDIDGDGIVSLDEVLNSSTSGGDSDEEIDAVLEPGEYFINVFSFSGDTDYSLDLSATPTGVGGPGNTLETAVDLGVLNMPQLETGFVGTDDSNDFYRFSIEVPSDFNLMLTGLVADADVRLLGDIDGDGVVSIDEVLNSSTSGGDTDEEIDVELEAGEYFINVFSFSDNETDYSLELSAMPIGPIDPIGPGNSLETAVDLGVLNIPQLETGFVGTDDSNDFYRFSIEVPSDFNLMLTGLVADADVRLLGDIDGDGVVSIDEVLNSSTSGGDTDEEIDVELEPGEYFINVFSFSDNETDYDLTVSATAISELPRLSIDDVTVTEGDEGSTEAVFTVSLSEAIDVTVDYSTDDGTATEGEDYVATSGTLTFSDGETSQTITVEVLGDTIEEADETFFVNLETVTDNIEIEDASGEGTIVDNDGQPLIVDVIKGTSLEDTLDGTPQNNVLIGLAGDDEIDAIGGEDILFGGSGNDNLDGGMGDDLIYGGDGNDLIFGGSGNDTLIGEAGQDFMLGGSGSDIFVFSETVATSILAEANAIVDFDVEEDFIGLDVGLTRDDIILEPLGTNTAIKLASDDSFLAIVNRVMPDQLTDDKFQSVNMGLF